MERGALEELARSIATMGLIQPLTVKPTPAGYEVVAGHRRLLALRMSGIAECAVMILDGDSEQQAAVMLVENIQRADLTPVEEARSLSKMQGLLGMSISECAEALSRSEAWVRGRLDLLTWPTIALEALADRRSSCAALRPLMDIENEVERNRLLACAIDAGATAELTRTWARQAQGYATDSPEVMGSRSRAMLAIGDVVVSMPCFSCRQARDAFSLQVVRICQPCLDELESAVPPAAPAQDVAG
jgi:ParB family chromosome partitioning protein